MTEYQVALNADMGESFGLYRLGNDELLMKYLTTVNLACGFHAGDPVVMRDSVGFAQRHNVQVGAHPGFADRQGFGRRMLSLSPDELYADLLYQFGALDAFVRVQGLELTHVCPHGKMDPLVSEQEEYAAAFIQAIRDYKSDMLIIAEDKCLLTAMAQQAGVRVARVGYPDLKYDAHGNYVVDRDKRPMDPAYVAAQSVRMVKEGRCQAVDGQFFPVQADVLTYHSDVPNALEIMEAVHAALVKEGVQIVGF